MRPGRTRPVGGADVVALPHRQRPGRARLDRRRAAPAARRRRPPRLRHPPSRRGPDHRPARTATRISPRWSARPACPGACSATACSRAACRRSWEVRPEEFPLAGEVLDRATGLIVHSHYVEEQAREHGYDGPLWRIPHPAWPAPAVEPARGRRRAADRLLRAHQREQAHPAAAARVRRAAADASRRAPAARRLGGARASTSPAGSSGPGSTPSGVIREPYVEEAAALVADGGVRRVRAAARADDGRDVGQRDPDALARQAARRQRRRLVRRAAGRRRAEDAGRRRRGGRPR